MDQIRDKRERQMNLQNPALATKTGEKKSAGQLMRWADDIKAKEWRIVARDR